MLRTFACTALAALLGVTSPAQTGASIRIWKVGSPHTGGVPHSGMPAALAREAGSRGWRVSVEAFPAQAFANRFLAAVRSGSAPDVLVFENFGTMTGIVTELGSFAGVGQDPIIRNQLIRVTSSFDELLGPAGGWTFLFTASPNYAAARELALRAPGCESPSSAPSLPADLALHDVAAAYLAGNSAAVLPHADPERLAGPRPSFEPVTVGGVAVCGRWGNERIAFATVKASYAADTAIGHAALLLAFRKTASLWRLLVAARDPISNQQFVAALQGLSKLLTHDVPAGPLPAPAMLRSPQNDHFPIPPNGARFGNFTWQSSASEDVVAEIAELSYHDDARLVLRWPRQPAAPQGVSSGQLWTTRSAWTWRVWSITRSGDIAFSEARTFVH